MDASNTSPLKADEVAQSRHKLVLDQARATGLLGGAKNERLSGRVSAKLIAAAKRRAHVSSDTKLLELALSNLALEDDFGSMLVERRGSIDGTLVLDL